MLPQQARLRHRAEFSDTIRRGARAGTSTLVAHLVSGSSDAAPCAGFIVSRAIGSAVVRNRVRRRLRALVRARLDQLPAGSALVVRALPAAGTASTPRLAADLDLALARVGHVRQQARAGVTR